MVAALDRVEIYNPASGTFAPLGSLQTPRAFHTATLLDEDDGRIRILIVGGVGLFDGDIETVRPAELLDPNTGTSREVAASVGPAIARAWHTSTLRKIDGNVVVAGGREITGDTNTVLDSVEIYDVDAQRFTSNPGDVAIQLPAPRAEHRAVLLARGVGIGADVLIIGGVDAMGVPQASTFRVKNNNDSSRYEVTQPGGLALTTARTGHTAQRIAPGEGALIVVVGGRDANGDALDSVEILNTSTFEISPGGALARARSGHATIELPFTNRLTVVGGQDSTGGFVGEAGALNYNATTGAYEAYGTPGTMVQPRAGANATLLSNGLILVTGGVGSSDEGALQSVDTVELLNADDDSPASTIIDPGDTDDNNGEFL
jgi:hypothetical protein